ncbi:MAG: UvrD-helicase domain-containing protein [bacterium]
MNQKTINVQQFPEVRVVEASAGSGKTHALTEHFIKLIINKNSSSQDIKNVLAITFTRQAAREMKERILGSLKKIALNKPADFEEVNRVLQALVVGKKEAQSKAHQLVEYIIRNFNYFQVQTIDSFINMILSGCSYKLKLSSQFEIKDEYSEYLSYSLDRIIDKAMTDNSIRDKFSEFIKQYLFLENKLGWSPRKDIMNIMSSLLYNVTVYGKGFKKIEVTYKDILDSKLKVIKMLSVLRKDAPEGTNKTLLNVLDTFLTVNTKYFDINDFASRKTLLSKDFPIKKGYDLTPNIKSLWCKIQKSMSTIAGLEARFVFNCYLDIFNMVYDMFREFALKDNALFLGELNAQAKTLIAQNNLTVPELYLRLANRFKHYLIDEFQDTSALRWRNLSEMVTDGLSSGGSLFYVGDRKQAIFRFTGGDISLFEKVQDELKAFNVKSDSLTTNYRSQKEIVEFNNRVFSKENLERFLSDMKPADDEHLKILSTEEIREILHVFSDSRQEHKSDKAGGYVCVNNVEYVDKEDREERIAEELFKLLGAIKKRFNLNDIAFLCRSNNEVELVSGWLIEHGIAVESEKTLNLKNNIHIIELISFLKFLNSPIDNLAFASFILGDIFRKASGLEKQEVEKFLFLIKNKFNKSKNHYVYREFRLQFPEIWEDYFEEFFKSVGFMNLYEFVVDIMSKFRVQANFGQHQGFFMHLLEVIKSLEDEYHSLADFLEYYENLKGDKLFVNSSNEEAVRVMSIHKSKGLEFGAVVIPFFELEFRDLSSNNNKDKVSYVVYPSNEDLLLLRLDSKYALLSDSVKKAYKEEYVKTLIDELDIIYVACTRAINELYIFVPFKQKGSTNLAKSLIPEDSYLKGTNSQYISKPEDSTESVKIPISGYRSWKDMLKDEFDDISRIRNRKQILGGEIIHKIFSFIGNLNNQNIKEVLAKAKDQTEIFFPFVSDYSHYVSVIEQLVKSELAKNFFLVEKGNVFNEIELVDGKGFTKRIDRLIVKEDEILVIDYKTRGELILKYREQLKEYMKVIGEIYPKKRIRGLIIFVEEVRVEEI